MVTSILRAFPDEFTDTVEEPAPLHRPRRLPIPKLVDLTNGSPVYDDTFSASNPTGPTPRSIGGPGDRE